MVSSLQLIHAILNLIDPSIRQRRSEKQIFDSLQETSVDHRAWPENFSASVIENKKYFAIDDSFLCVLGVRAHIKKRDINTSMHYLKATVRRTASWITSCCVLKLLLLTATQGIIIRLNYLHGSTFVFHFIIFVGPWECEKPIGQ